NGRAVPVLNAEVVDAQSAGIDMVSGATYTSEAYIRSLQSAIDQANL
ncbi:MAG: FMN-binding protein, partial [Dermatophilaceae bacterium]|nr:FMN-binding protein [Dermatophilaceae bacterium]